MTFNKKNSEPSTTISKKRKKFSHTTKIDLKKEFPEFYSPNAKAFEIQKIPPMNFFKVDGQGDPNTSPLYQDAMATLYTVAYSLKMDYKKQTGGKDYVVPPLEGLWYMDSMENWNMSKKDNWQWTMMIRIPDFVPQKAIIKAIDVVKDKKRKKSPLIDELRVETYDEGLVAQIMYLGPYSDEPPTISKMHNFINKKGYKLDGLHHEIYLSNPKRVKPERLKTILRQPISK